MMVVNTETVPGKRIVEVKGLVQGNTVRAKHAGRDIAASFKNLVGGELKGYTELLVESQPRSDGAHDCAGGGLLGECGCQCPFRNKQHHRRSRGTLCIRYRCRACR